MSCTFGIITALFLLYFFLSFRFRILLLVLSQTLPLHIGPSASSRVAALSSSSSHPESSSLSLVGGAEHPHAFSSSLLQSSSAGLGGAEQDRASFFSGDLMYIELFEAVDRLQDDHIKMLNLSREWLNSLLPHLLQKINRVRYAKRKQRTTRLGSPKR